MAGRAFNRRMGAFKSEMRASMAVFRKSGLLKAGLRVTQIAPVRDGSGRKFTLMWIGVALRAGDLTRLINSTAANGRMTLSAIKTNVFSV